MKSISKFFRKLLIVNLAAVSLAISSEGTLFIPNEYGLNLQKMKGNKEELSTFEETGRLESYVKGLRYPLESPFGIYVVYEGDTPVAIQGLSHHFKQNALIASEMIDVLKDYQGKKYGSRLRAATAKFLEEKYLGNFVTIDQESEKSLWPLTYLHSCNEWCWGENIESLKSSLNAGYRIACIARSGTIQMLYTNDKEILQKLWPRDRTDQLLKIASMFQNPETYNEEEFKNNLGSLLESLDFTQETDITTFLNMHYKSVSQDIIGKPWGQTMREEVANFTQTLSDIQRKNITTFSQEKRISDTVQNISIDLLDFCLGPYSDWYCHSFIPQGGLQ